MNNLPNEVLSIIFQHCAGKERKTIRLVCRRWNEIIIKQFSRFFRGITIKTLPELMDFKENNRMYKVTSLYFDDDDEFDDLDISIF